MATETPVLDAERVLDDLLAGIGRIPPVLPPDDGDSSQPPREPSRRPVIDNVRLGMLILLGAESMFFGGLIAAFLVLRLGAPIWPPPFQPRLPLLVTGINSLILLASSFTMWKALRALRRGNPGPFARGLGLTALLGATFLAVQGYEWARLVHFGLTVSSGAYGATFYTLIGAHGLHVAGALAWLSVVLVGAHQGRFKRNSHAAVTACGMYWQYVVFLWPILYGLVYLA
jgi:heme/copper-type cytochrome/quinol oxidase subunit 3